MPTYDLVVVHPLVLLSVVDHYNRVAKDTKKRVVGILLGETYKGRIDITNCFAVPFEEDERDPNIWFLDHSYLEGMSAMFKKVNAKERILGFYSTGPRLREADLDISDLLSSYAESPLLLICEVQPKEMGLPTTAYYPKEQIREDGTQKSQKVFVNIPTEVGATEAEEIGVEHLLRDVKDSTVSNLSSEVSHMASGLRALKSRLSEVQEYLNLVLEGRLPVNHDIMYHLQDVFNLLPNLSVEELLKSFAIKSNDMMLAVYLASMIRSVLALHNLIDNQEQRVWQEKLGQKRPELKNGKAKDDKFNDKETTADDGKAAKSDSKQSKK
ncbi:MAG: 26S proteasome regulatory subunit [Trebouxia sp. A1-2]|nr:MAG: 26S proteasome regulatory subunit [Trebouxia sp. A1-2]